VVRVGAYGWPDPPFGRGLGRPAWLAGRRKPSWAPMSPSSSMTASVVHQAGVAIAHNIRFAQYSLGFRRYPRSDVRSREHGRPGDLPRQCATAMRVPQDCGAVLTSSSLRWTSQAQKAIKKQNPRSVFDALEWSPNGVTDLARVLESVNYGRECRLGKTLLVRVLSVTEFPEHH
jgi:hypothetical protein